VLIIPDFIANAGGVITASVEYHGGTEKEAFERIEETISQNTKEILDKVRKQNITPREAAESIAMHRVRQAMRYRE
jgi:glutamate dehydrogenase (NAD(P)+)